MTRQSYTRLGRRPARAEPLLLTVVRRSEVSPGFVRVTLGGDLSGFDPMGFDQWARLFVGARTRAKVPHPLTPRSYLRHLLAVGDRPLMRSFTIADARLDELDIDVVVHPAATPWGEIGTPVAVLDQGIGFAAPAAAPVSLVGDASALPAITGILRSLPADAVGQAVVVLDRADRRDLPRPAGVDLAYVDSLRDTKLPASAGTFGWVAGEASMVADVRRRWLAQGVPKRSVAFCGYWRR